MASTKEQTVKLVNVQPVDARQSGAWTLGIEATKNTVRLSNTTENPLPVKVIGNGSSRQPFPKRIIGTPLGNGFLFMPIPAGERTVIENISVIARCAADQRREVNYFLYFDKEGSDGGIADIRFQCAQTDQRVFNGTSIFSAGYKIPGFAEEIIGTNRYQVGFQARLNRTAIGSPRAQVTFSGYLEDLATNL